MSEEIAEIATRMNRLEQDITYAKEEQDTLWKRFFEICDDLVGENVNYKHVVLPEHPRPGLSIAREMHQAAPKLLADELVKELTPAQWKAVSTKTRVLDMEKLEKEIAKGEIKTDLVAEYTEYKEPVAHRKFKIATKKELKDAKE